MIDLVQKPHTSITAWIDLLTTEKYDEDDYEGITELVESVNIQTSTGPTEASRAVRKKVRGPQIRIGGLHFECTRDLSIQRELWS